MHHFKHFDKTFRFKTIIEYFYDWNKFKTRSFLNSFPCLLGLSLHKYSLNTIYLLKYL